MSNNAQYLKQLVEGGTTTKDLPEPKSIIGGYLYQLCKSGMGAPTDAQVKAAIDELAETHPEVFSGLTEAEVEEMINSAKTDLDTEKQDKIMYQVDYSDLAEGGLVSSYTGNVWTNTDKAIHITLNVNPNEVYIVSCTSNNSDYCGAFFKKGDVLVSKALIGNGVAYTDEVITIPSNADTLVVNCLTTLGTLSVKEIKNVTSESFAETLNSINAKNTEIKSLEFENECLRNRCKRFELGNDIVWKTFDKKYFVFIIDDVRNSFPSYEEVFHSESVPCSSAVIISAINSDVKRTALQRMVLEGGEVFAHYSGNLTEETSYDLWLEKTRDVKMILEEKYSFKVRGLIRADYTVSNSDIGEDICQKYFDYSDSVGKSTMYKLSRKNIWNFNSKDDFVNMLDTQCSENGLYIIGMHGDSPDKDWVTPDSIREIIQYIKSKTNCEITSLSNVYDNFAITSFEKRLLALEN